MTKLKSIIEEKDEKLAKLNENYKFLNEQLTQTRENLVNVLRREEQARKIKQKEWVNSMILKLGKPIDKFSSMSNENWDDGEEIILIKSELLNISKQKEALDIIKSGLINKQNELTAKGCVDKVVYNGEEINLRHERGTR